MSVQTDSRLLLACWATAVILVMMSLVFFRSKKRSYALAVLPLALPSVMYIVSGVLARSLDRTIFFASSFQIRIALDLAAALVSCVLIGFASNVLSASKRTRMLFCLCCTAFVVVFSGLLIMSSVVQIASV